MKKNLIYDFIKSNRWLLLFYGIYFNRRLCHMVAIKFSLEFKGIKKITLDLINVTSNKEEILLKNLDSIFNGGL